MPFAREPADFEKLINDALGQSEIRQQLSNVNDKIVEKLKAIVREQSEEIWDAAKAEIERYTIWKPSVTMTKN
jgi:hypothetical protein